VHAATEATEDADVAAAPMNAEARAIGARVAALEPQRLPERLRFDRVSV
jgi:hypothetical protein